MSQEDPKHLEVEDAKRLSEAQAHEIAEEAKKHKSPEEDLSHLKSQGEK